jgi:hypothetical protein
MTPNDNDSDESHRIKASYYVVSIPKVQLPREPFDLYETGMRLTIDSLYSQGRAPTRTI